MTLLEKAQSAPRGNKRNYDTIVDAVEVLRAKGWGYRRSTSGSPTRAKTSTRTGSLSRRLCANASRTEETNTHNDN
jgi:hypothetical protein